MFFPAVLVLKEHRDSHRVSGYSGAYMNEEIDEWNNEALHAVLILITSLRVKAQASLHLGLCTVSPDHTLLAHMQYGASGRDSHQNVYI